MNFAFQALVILILALPGIIFERFTHPEHRFREKRELGDEVVYGVIFSAALHGVWCGVAWLLESWTCVSINLHHVFVLASGPYSGNVTLFDSAVRSVTSFPSFVLAYFLGLYAFSAIAGKLLGKVLTAQSTGTITHILAGVIDHGPVIRKVREWQSDLKQPEQVLSAVTLFAAVVELGGTAYLYAGLLDPEQIKFGDDGEPSRFVLNGAMRRRLEDDDDDFYTIKSDRFILRMSDVKTLNVWWAGITMPDVLIGIDNDNISSSG